ncbi:MAG: glycosyltransferase family 39 protein [bacterium]
MKAKQKKEITIDKKEIIIVSLLLLVALIFRLIYLSSLKANDPSFYNPPLGTDMLTYDNYAKQILDGTFSNKGPYYYGPLYFYFLALIYKIFGIDPYFPRLIQMILGVLTSFLTYLIAKKVFNKPIGYISLIISILYAMFYIHEGVLLMESLITFLNTLSIFLLLRIEDNPSYKNIAFAGISLGLSALARANILLFIPFLLPWMLINSKFKIQNSKFLRYGFLCLIILLTISPATIRNYLVSGRFVLISTNGPVNLWIGNNPYADGEYTYPPSHYQKMVDDIVRKKGDGAYIDEVIRFFKNNPKGFFLLQLKKFLLFWQAYEIENNTNYPMQRNYSWLLRLPIFLGFGSVGILALVGTILSIKSLRRILLLYLFLFSGMLSIVIVFILGRYKICFLPIFIIFAGFSLNWWYEKIKERKLSPILLSLIPLFFSGNLVYSQYISGFFYPLVHPEGIHKEIEGVIVIKDNGDNERLSKDAFVLKGEIKKELIITENLQKFKEIILFFSYQAEKPGALTVDINGRIRGDCSIGGSGSLLQIGSIRLNPSLFNKGKNTIVISSSENFLFPIDEGITFKRSFFLKNGRWESLKKGEFMVWLELIR